MPERGGPCPPLYLCGLLAYHPAVSFLAMAGPVPAIHVFDLSIMSMDTSEQREPILNVPAVVVLLLALLGLIHAAREWLLSPQADRLLVMTFGFVPERYEDLWTYVTYAFLHADLMHLGFNAIWLLAFGSPIARRFGTLRFLAFFAVTVAAGALAHLITHRGELAPMIGASAAISGTMGGAARFVFQRGGPLDPWRSRHDDVDRIPAAPLGVALRNPGVLAFVGVWFGLNLLFGLGSLSIAGADQSVAWEAHVGGFLVGLLLFSAFDRRPEPAWH